MSRDLSAGFVSAVTAKELNLAWFAWFEFDGGTVRFWTGVGDMTLDGETYNGVGSIGSFSEVVEGRSPEAPGMRFMLNGIPSTVLATVFGETYRNRPCALYMAAMNDGFTAVTASALIFSGVMSTAKLTDDGEMGVLMIEAENELADLMYPNLVRFTQNHQQRIFPGDTGLRFISSITVRKIWWGRIQTTGRVIGGGGGEDPRLPP
jgi:hypothetical protein